MKGLNFDKDKISEFCRRHDMVFLGLFGSFARGDQKLGSDVDFIVRFSKPKSLLELVEIELELTEFLGRKVDLLTEASISPYLRDRILSETRAIYEG
ncbi:MAG: nucleotidyltransferase family protein [Bacillota bacterium]